MGTIVILIGHDHDGTITKTLGVFVVDIEFHAHDFNNVLDFEVFSDRFGCGITNV